MHPIAKSYTNRLSASQSDLADQFRYPWLFRTGWLSFFAGTPFMGWNSLGLLLLIIHIVLERSTLARFWIGSKFGHAAKGSAARPLVIAVLGLATTGSISAALAVEPGRAFASLLGIVLSMAFGLFYGALLEAHQRGWYVRYLWPLVLSTVAHAGWALWSFLGGHARATTFAPPTGVGTLMLFGIALGAVWFLAQRDWRRWLLIPYGAWTGAALVVTLTRGAWLGLAVLFLIALAPAWRHRRLRPYALAALALALVACVVTLSALPSVARRAANLFVSPERLGIYGAAVEMFLDHPVFGVGPSNFGEHWATYAPEWIRQHFGFPHNTALQVLTETGLLGGVFFGLALLRILISIMRLRRTNDLALWVLASGVVAILVRDQVDTAIFNINLAFAFWWMAGTVFGAEQHLRNASGAWYEYPHDAAASPTGCAADDG